VQGILGVVDGLCPTAFETPDDQKARKDFLRMIGYKR
jgi:adenosine/AMP kinase